MRILLARHAETEAGLGCYIGITDLPLADPGFKQASGLAETLKQFNPSRCFCSPLLRTRQTAEVATADYNLEIELLDDLREVDFGRWEGLDFEEISRCDPELVEAWGREVTSFKFPGGEHNLSFWQRVKGVAEKLASLDGTVLVVSHGGVIRAMLCHFLGLGFHDYLLFNVKPARLTVLDVYEGGGVLAGFNL